MVYIELFLQPFFRRSCINIAFDIHFQPMKIKQTLFLTNEINFRFKEVNILLRSIGRINETGL